MNAATITALCTGIAGVITAVTALVKVFRHTHQGTADPTGSDMTNSFQPPPESKP